MIFLLFLVFPAHASEDTLTAITYNIESGPDTDPAVVARKMAQAPSPNIWLLQEAPHEEAVLSIMNWIGGKRWAYVLSDTGERIEPFKQADYLAVLYDRSALRLLETVELVETSYLPGAYGDVDPDDTLRRVQFLRFEHFASGAEFWISNLHQRCCAGFEGLREHQSKITMDWVTERSVPVILGGDFNIPVEPGTNGNSDSNAFSAITDSLSWISPSNPVRTLCIVGQTSMVDHFFVTPSLREIASTTILFEEPEYCELDPDGHADHRPVMLELELTSSVE